MTGCASSIFGFAGGGITASAGSGGHGRGGCRSCRLSVGRSGSRFSGRRTRGELIFEGLARDHVDQRGDQIVDGCQ